MARLQLPRTGAGLGRRRDVLVSVESAFPRSVCKHQTRLENVTVALGMIWDT